MIIKELHFDPQWGDYVTGAEDSDHVNLVFCDDVCHKYFGVTDKSIVVRVSPSYMEDALRLSRAGREHYFLETEVDSNRFSRHYVYNEARALIDQEIDKSTSKAVWITVKGIDD